MIETGGRDLVLVEDDNGLGAIHYCFQALLIPPNSYHQLDELFVLLIKEEGILGKFGGVFGFGGMFVEYDCTMRIIFFDHWADIAVFIEIAIQSLPQEQRPPILHAAIIVGAPVSVRCITK